jgi:broad specificity phosphatase PhoE
MPPPTPETGSNLVVLIRHCQPQVDQAAPAATWGLTDAGRAQARRLLESPLLDRPAAVACGPEPKMTQSVEWLAGRAGTSVVASPAFGESRGQGWFEPGQFERVVAAFFAEPARPPAAGWEPADVAAGRFLAGLRELVAEHGGGRVVVCSGGRVLTAVLCELGLIARSEAFEKWKALQMPDLAAIDLDRTGGAVLRRPFGTGGAE